MAFVEKHRPRAFDDVIGNGATVRRLQNILAKAQKDPEKDPFPNVLFFLGPTGTGKTTCARIIGNELLGDDLAEDQNFIELNAAQNNGIDVVRELTVNSMSKPMIGDYKIYLIDEAQEMTPQAKKAMLKMLEDAKHSTIFILCSMEPGRLDKSLTGRGSVFKFDFPSRDDLKTLVTRICKAEDMDMNKEVFDLIIRESQGSTRQFVQHLDAINQLGASTPEELQEVVEGYFLRNAAHYELANEFVEAISMPARMKVLAQVDNCFQFTGSILDACASRLDNGSANLEQIVRITQGVLKAREQIQVLIGVDPKMVLVANLA